MKSSPADDEAPAGSGTQRHGTDGRAFRLLRHFSVVSLVCIVLASMSLTLFLRRVAVREIVEFGEYNNIVLAQSTLGSVRAATLEFLEKNRDVTREQVQNVRLPVDLEEALMALHSANSVVRIKIFNQRGWLVYSSGLDSLGHDQSDEAEVQAALSGQVASVLNFHDAFSLLDRKTPNDNLIETYVPIAFGPGDPVRGVFEIYVDVNSRVADIERAQWQIIGAAAFVMTLLYLALLTVVRSAETVIQRQQSQIRAHAQMMEQLSARMLQHQEEEKKRIAFDLHEGLAQTLASVKLRVEAVGTQLSAPPKGLPSSIASTVQTIKDAIAEVRSMALNLRPSSLDDLGLRATIDWFFRGYAQRHPEITVEAQVSLTDAQIPQSLRIIIFRVIEAICQGLGSTPSIRHIGLQLQLEQDRITLLVSHDADSAAESMASDQASADLARQKVLLSGGEFHISPLPQGGRSLRASWLV